MRASCVRTFFLCALGACLLAPAYGHSRCVVSVSMVNHNRYAYETSEECSRFFHSAPWGNWGVSSNVGSKRDADQFKGWRKPCSYTKVEWNSCSERSRYRSSSYLNFPNRYADYPLPANGYPYSDPYSWNDGVPPYGEAYNVDQYSPCGPNIYGGFQVSQEVSPPIDNDGDGISEAGGCACGRA